MHEKSRRFPVNTFCTAYPQVFQQSIPDRQLVESMHGVEARFLRALVRLPADQGLDFGGAKIDLIDGSQTDASSRIIVAWGRVMSWT